MLSVSIATDGSPLVFDDPSTGLWVESLTRAGKTWRRSYSSSPFHHGDTLTAATLAQEQMVASVYLSAASSAALQTLREAVEDAFSQFVFDMTVTEDGVTKVYTCDISDVAWDARDEGMVGAHLARATVTIPCYPVPA